MSHAQGALYCGDNLAVLREHVGDASVDLVYLDPPFNSKRSYDVTARARPPKAPKSASPPEAPAFEDTWRWDEAAEATYAALTEKEGSPSYRAPVAAFVKAMRAMLGESDPAMLAYLVMMAVRVVELHRALARTGSLYLHCDPTASHYLKLLLDAAFGPACFRNEIVWRYRRWPAKSRRFQRMHDVLLFYSKDASGDHTFHTLYGYEKLAASTLKTFGTKKQQADFSSGRRKPGVLEGEETQGPPMSDVWEVGVIAAIGKERVGYPTQKPEALLERVVRASSDPGDVVLDPFCGSGTTVVVAARLGRRWIGIDESPIAIELARSRLGAVPLALPFEPAEQP